MHWEQEEEQTRRLHLRLASDPDFLPVSTDAAETALFRDHDLASFVENRLGVLIDPVALAEPERSLWTTRATDDHEIGNPHSGFLQAFWLVARGGARVGTISVSNSTLGGGTPGIFSLFVSPAHRGQGHGKRALQRVRDLAIDEGLSGIRLGTDWCWQAAVRFYLGIGMWIRGWKRALDFTLRADLPPWRIEIDGDTARFLTVDRLLIAAHRRGDRLDWQEQHRDPLLSEARGTFATALAVRGWPLLRSDQIWARQLAQGFSDCGGPEGLAFQVRQFEAWATKHFWRVDAPRIPGLDYPDWDALQTALEP